MASPGAVVGTLVVAAAMFLAAAKAHGREVRLEREAMGHPFVLFGGKNAPEVEALWSLDRRTYWAVAGGAAALGLASFILDGRGLFLLGGPYDTVLEGLARVLLLPMVVAFGASGGASLLRKVRRGPQRGRHRHGSLFWWGLVGSLLVVFAALCAAAP